MKGKYKIMAFSLASLLAVSGIAYALSIATITTNVTVLVPPVQVTSASFNGSACSVSGSQITCSGSAYQGSTVSLSINVNNPASVSQSVHTLSTIPSSCTGISVTDVPSTSVPAGSSATLNVQISISPNASLMTCSIVTSLLS